MSKDEAIKLAIEWIEKQPEEITASKYDVDTRYVVLKELEEALAKQEQDEPVGEMQLSAIIEGVVPVVPFQLPVGTKLYTTPQQRTWVDLTDEEVNTLWDEWKDAVCLDHKTWAQAIRAKLKEKNT